LGGAGCAGAARLPAPIVRQAYRQSEVALMAKKAAKTAKKAKKK